MAYPNPNIITSGTTFAQLQAGGLSAILEKLVTANQAAETAPTAAATATPTGGGASGGLLAAGTYYFVFTETNGIGETTKSPEGVQLTVAATNIPQFTFPALQTNNTARNLYLGAVNGSTGGPYKLYASGITTTTYSASIAAPSNSYAMTPPTVNTTGFTYVDANGNTVNFALQAVRSAKVGKLQDTYNTVSTTLDRWLRGDPLPPGAIVMKIRHAHTAFAMLAQACAEAGTLADANAGTLAPGLSGGSGATVTGVGVLGGGTVPQTKRTWP